MPDWELRISATCAKVEDHGYACMICPPCAAQPATGHIVVDGGRHDRRILALTCRQHSAERGWKQVKAKLDEWAGQLLLDGDGGPGLNGCPTVRHVVNLEEHWDVLDDLQEHL